MAGVVVGNGNNCTWTIKKIRKKKKKEIWPSSIINSVRPLQCLLIVINKKGFAFINVGPQGPLSWSMSQDLGQLLFHCGKHPLVCFPTLNLVRRCDTERRSSRNVNQYSSGNRLYLAPSKLWLRGPLNTNPYINSELRAVQGSTCAQAEYLLLGYWNWVWILPHPYYQCTFEQFDLSSAFCSADWE